MTKPWIKALLGGAAIAAVAAMVPMTCAHAQVQCFSNGFSWHCQGGYVAPVMPSPGWGYQPGGSNNFYGDYNQIPNDYPGPAPVESNR